MRIKVRLFAISKEIAGRNEIIFEVPNQISCQKVLSRLQAEIPALFSILESCFVAINGSYVDKTMGVSEGDEVAILPPVSGG